MATITQYNTFTQALNSIQTSGPVYNMIKTLSDGVTVSSPTLAYLNKHSKTPFTGGDMFSWRIVDSEKTATSYFAGATLDTSVDEFLGTANIVRAYYTQPVTYFKTDLLQNQGKDLLVKYVAERMNRAVKGMGTRLALDLFGNGTTDANTGVAGGTATVIRPIIGMQLALEADASPSNTYAGIARSSSTEYWNNAYLSVSTIAGVTLEAMHKMFSLCNRLESANGGTDLIILPINAYRQVWLEAKTLQAHAPNAKAQELGFPESFTFNGAAVIPEKFISASTEGGYLDTGLNMAFFINTSDMEWAVASDDDVKIGPVLQPTNEHSFVQHITWSGQLLFKTPPLHGCMYWS